MKIKVYGKKEQLKNSKLLENIIFPHQTHSNNIIEIKTGKENLDNCDAVFCSRKYNFKLGIKTADCAPIVFYDEKRYGILHAGWRGLVNGILEKMLEKFNNPEIYVGPFLKQFEIQKDFCYDAIYDKFGDKFFEEKKGKIIFNFEKALKFVLGDKVVFDKRDTLKDEDLYSWRENKTFKRNITIIENDL